MNQSQLNNIIEFAPDEFAGIISDLSPHILTASANALSQTADEPGGGKPKVSIALKIVIDLSKSPPAWHCEGAVGVRHTVKGDAHDEDATPTLPGLEGGES